MKIIFLSFILLTTLYSGLAISGEKVRFAIVPKVNDAPFFLKVKEGCEAAAKRFGYIECVYHGPAKASVREMDRIIHEHIDAGIDGIAVAILTPTFLINSSLKRAFNEGIPVVTFDSDIPIELLEKNISIRRAFVGTDNFRMGQVLGEMLIAQKGKGGEFAIITGHTTSPNLNERVAGVRSALSNSSWEEQSRSPLYSEENGDLARNQMYELLDRHKNSNFGIISVGGWPQKDPIKYETMMSPFAGNLSSGKHSVLIGDTSKHQIMLLNQGLASVNVGQNPKEMGATSIQLLNDIYLQKPVQEINYTRLNVCAVTNLTTCEQYE